VLFVNKLKSLIPVSRKRASRAARKYAAAQIGRLQQGWITQPQLIDFDIRAGLTTLRARSREEAQNNGYYKGFLRDLQENVVGAQGFQLISKPMDSDTLVDVEAKNSIERHWKIWMRKESRPELSGMGFNNFCKLVIRSAALDGEVFIWERKGEKKNPYRYSLRLMEPGSVDVNVNTEGSALGVTGINLAPGNVVRMGIEFDADRFPVAYHVLASERDLEFFINAATGRKYIRVPSNEIIHLFLHDGIWQTRGVPWIHPALLRFNALGKYEEAELVSARGGASKMGFITDADDGTGYTGDDDDDEDDEEELIEEFVPGMIGRLKKGQEFTSFDPDHPNAIYPDFVKTNLRGIAAALGESYNQFAQDLEGVSFGSLRQGALSERAVWMGLQKWLIDEAFDRIFSAWLESGLQAQAITNRNGRPLPFERITKFLEHEWQPRRWEWIDPLKDTSADRMQQQDLTMSRSERIRKRGRQPTEVFTEIAAERELMENLGIESAQVDATLGSDSVGDRLTMLETVVSELAEGQENAESKA